MGITVRTQGQPSLDPLHSSVPLSPSAPGPILLLILTRSLGEFSVIACSHINVMFMTTGQVLAVFVVRDLIEMDVFQIPLCFQTYFMTICRQLNYICMIGFV